MDNDHAQHDDALLDRLVDGELSVDERRQLLAELDGRPDGWRRCALAFLEAQSWRGEMRQVVSELEVPQGAIVTAAQIRGRSLWSKSSGTLLAIAASLLVAFFVGQQFPSEQSRESGVEFADLPNPAPRATDVAPSRNGDAITLVVNDAQGVPHRVEVPLVEGRHLGEQFAEAPEWSSPELHRQLQQQGIGLKARRRYAPLWFVQENEMVPMVVPVDDARIVPVSRPVF